MSTYAIESGPESSTKVESSLALATPAIGVRTRAEQRPSAPRLVFPSSLLAMKNVVLHVIRAKLRLARVGAGWRCE
jgi:hypothetical protein